MEVDLRIAWAGPECASSRYPVAHPNQVDVVAVVSDEGEIMVDEVVVWNLDARNRPDLEVEIEVVHVSDRRVRAVGTQPPLSTKALLENVEIPFVQLDEFMEEPSVDAYVAHDGSIVFAG